MTFRKVMEMEKKPFYIYATESKRELIPKCKFCNEDRKRVLIDEKTKEKHLIKCECDKRLDMIHPEKYYLEQIVINCDGSIGFNYNRVNCKCSSWYVNDIKKDFKKNYIRSVKRPMFYENESDCQKHCDMENANTLKWEGK